MKTNSKTAIKIVVIALVVAVVFGVITRLSYKTYDVEDAKLSENIYECVQSSIESLTTKKVLRDLKSSDSVFIVTVKSRENIYTNTRTVAVVDRVIKGDENVLGTDIVIYEPNFILYNKENKEPYYNLISCLNNVMQVGKQYLVFTDSVDYYEGYQETLDYYEFLVNIDITLYSFPIDDKIDFITYEDELTFGDIQTYDYICFTREQCDFLEKVRKDVFEKYI